MPSSLPQDSGDSKTYTAIPLSSDHKPDRADECKRILDHKGRVHACKAQDGTDLGPPRVWLAKQDGMSETSALYPYFFLHLGIYRLHRTVFQSFFLSFLPTYLSFNFMCENCFLSMYIGVFLSFDYLVVDLSSTSWHCFQ